MERRRVLGSLAGVGAAVILGSVALAAASGGAGAAPSGPARGDPPGMMLVAGVMPRALLGPAADQLGLTPEQRQLIRGYFDQAKPGFVQLHRQMRVNAELLLRTQPDDPAYQTVVATVSQSAADLASQFVLQASQLRSQLHGVLTGDQRIKLAALEVELESRRLERQRPPPDGGGVP